MAREFSVGVCWNNLHGTPLDSVLYGMGDFTGAKFMAHHRESEAVMVRNRNPGSTIVWRLPDLVPGKPDLIEEYVRSCVDVIVAAYPYCRIFQVDNEPQYNWRYKGEGPWQYQYYLKRIMDRLAEECVKRGFRVRFVSPPLSYSPALWTLDDTKQRNPTDFTLDDWREALRARTEDTGKSVYEYFDIYGANCYWQDPLVPEMNRRLQRFDTSFGAGFASVLADADLTNPTHKGVILLEAGSSWCDKLPKPPVEECRAIMAAQYPGYISYLRQSMRVMGVYFFILGGSQDWSGFGINDEVAAAISRW